VKDGAESEVGKAGAAACGALLPRVASGDRRALDELYAASARLLFAVAIRILGNPTVAEDAVAFGLTNNTSRHDEFVA